MAGQAGQVVAIEADAWLASLLRESAKYRQAGSAEVEVLAVAVTDSVGIASFKIASRSRAANYLATAHGSSQAGGIRETQSVIGVTLDWILDRRPEPSLIKIDVEGAEAQVPRGAHRTLSEARPVVLCEVQDRNAQVVTDLLHAYECDLFDLAGRASHRPIQLAADDTLAVPRQVHVAKRFHQGEPP
jgi:FkbM family methyltransferase